IGDPFFASVTEAIEEAVRQRGLFLVIVSASTSEQERAALHGLLHRSVCGLVLVPSSLDYGREDVRLRGNAVPVVFVDRPPIGMQADTVLIENEEVTFEATRHLLGHGHRRIAFVATSLETYTVRNRFDGYLRALKEASIEIDESLVLALRRAGDIPDALGQLLGASEPPTAVLSANARASIRAVHELHRIGRTDVAFVSFDDFETADALFPAVTVVRQDPAEMGRIAAELLLGRLDGDTSPPRRVLLQTQLLARGSGELPPTASRTPATAAPPHDVSASTGRGRTQQ
ncbi:MAG TPA: substrate-binding domain-containing protein, partial [Acidimicrobiales bacterium]|nr:substrate-binding domain-containing protein [Acidimicrobiales bacterium]